MRRSNALLLLEPQAIGMEWGGQGLGEVVLEHPKYSQLVLAANVREALNGVWSAEVLDLKAGGTASAVYRTLQYGEDDLSFRMIGHSAKRFADAICCADVVGISANFTCERASVSIALREVADLNPRATRIVGGHDASVNPDFYLRSGAHHVFVGDGERALVDFLQIFGQGSSPEVILSKGSRRVLSGSPCPSLPGPELLAANRFSECPDGALPPGVAPRVGVLETSRGCNEACSFCDSTFVVGTYRTLPLAQIRATSMGLSPWASQPSSLRTTTFYIGRFGNTVATRAEANSSLCLWNCSSEVSHGRSTMAYN